MSTRAGENDVATGLLDSDAAMRPFLDILKSKERMDLSTMRCLALQTIAHPEIFSGFDEFKSLCSQLLSPDAGGGRHSSIFNTLDLFSFGTLNDYSSHHQANGEYYLPMNEHHLAKLGQLTLLSCIQEACLNGKTSISYDSLSSATGKKTDDRAIEEVLIACLYSNLLKGRLCQKTRSFCWQGESLPVVLSRDVPPAQISNLLSALRGLEQRLEESRIDVVGAQKEVAQGLEGTVAYWKFIHLKKSVDLKDSLFKEGMGGIGPPSPASPRMDIRRQETGGVAFPGGSDASQNSSLRRSSKRSRGGMATKLVTDSTGYRT
mmetsp:Transcript_18378/g.42179  ORF Transcript_18378/g.42179 Transcript_18378/m.42179 type:complete len:319 (+) Transcript_18378:122-1078(+)